LVASNDALEVLLACLAIWSGPPGSRVVLTPSLLPAVIDTILTEQASGLLLGSGAEAPRRPGATLRLSVHLPKGGQEVALDWRQRCETRLTQLHACDDVIALLHTSGTTATPRVAAKCARQLLGEASLLAELFFSRPAGDVTSPARRVHSLVPPYHIFGLLLGVLVPFYSGAQLCAGSRSVTDLVAVPAQLSNWNNTSLHPDTKRIFCSAAPLPADLAEHWVARGVELIELLGSTETGGIAYRRRNDARVPWTALPGVLLDTAQAERLVIRSAFSPVGASEWFATEDRIRWVPGGFEHLGRQDDVIKVGGKRVALSDISRFTRELPGVTDALALAVPAGGLRGQSIWLLVVSPDGKWTEQRVREQLASRFDAVLLPRRIRCLRELPQSDSAKLTRQHALRLFE
jgi:acyl-coenzyme A synthetase/AMP-(fatty) acid ligase